LVLDAKIADVSARAIPRRISGAFDRSMFAEMKARDVPFYTFQNLP
jgi:hypothetical protein